MSVERGAKSVGKGKARGPGDWVRVVHLGKLCVGTVVDMSDGAAKRVRVQRGELQGEVVMPSQYRMVGWLDEAPEGE